MLDPKKLDEILSAVGAGLPQGLQRDMEKNLRAVLQSVFERLELVTREELEVQEAVLHRTRQKLETLEKKIAALEENLLKK